jgi:anti-sigma regulatory factor (Ser/Thr protein kinase)
MKDLSLHILDIAQNSISAGARKIKIHIDENLVKDKLTIIIDDDGKGIAPEDLHKVSDPYFTGRTTRKVGLGIPLFKQNAEMTDGSFSINSELNVGTSVKAVFGYNHIDRQPLGDIAGVMVILVSANTAIDFLYIHSYNEKEYVFDTMEIKEILDDIPLNDPAVIKQLREMINENLKDLRMS